MKIRVLIFSLCLAVAAAADCTSEQIEAMHNCSMEVEASTDFQLVKLEMGKILTQCVPGYRTNCTIGDPEEAKCFQEVEAQTVNDPSITYEEKRTTLAAMYKCIQLFPDDAIWEAIYDLAEAPMNASCLFDDIKEIAEAQVRSSNSCALNEGSLRCFIEGAMRNEQIKSTSAKVAEAHHECDQLAPQECRWKVAQEKIDCDQAKADLQKVNEKISECKKNA